VELLVDLEEDGRAVRRADIRVRLEQLAVLALVLVLGLAQVAELGLGAALLEQLLLLRPELVLLADELRRVGVEHRAVLGPDLHAVDDRHVLGGKLREHLAHDRVVDLGDRRRVALEEPVRQRALDEPAVDLHELPRPALGVLDRDVAQREVAADGHDGDRDEAARDEAGDRRPDARRRDSHRPVVGHASVTASQHAANLDRPGGGTHPMDANSFLQRSDCDPDRGWRMVPVAPALLPKPGPTKGTRPPCATGPSRLFSPSPPSPRSRCPASPRPVTAPTTPPGMCATPSTPRSTTSTTSTTRP